MPRTEKLCMIIQFDTSDEEFLPVASGRDHGELVKLPLLLQQRQVAR